MKKAKGIHCFIRWHSFAYMRFEHWISDGFQTIKKKQWRKERGLEM